jgi:integrase
LSASPYDVANYLFWLADEGSVAVPKSVQPYLSAISTAYRDHGLPSPVDMAAGGIIATTLNRLKTQHRDLQPGARIVPLPPKAARAMVNRGLELIALPATPDNLWLLVSCIATVLTFATGSRPSSIRTLRCADVVCSEATARVQRNYAKGANDSDSTDQTGLLPVTFPPCDFTTDLVTLLTHWNATALQRYPARALYFQMDSPLPSSVSTEWMAAAVLAVQAEPPAACKYTPKSCRQGFATYTHALGVPEDRINYIAGWAPGSKTSNLIYTDHSVTPDDDARYFFACRQLD